MILNLGLVNTKSEMLEALGRLAAPVTLKGPSMRDLPRLASIGVRHSSARANVETLLRGYWGTFILGANGRHLEYLKNYLHLFGDGTNPESDAYWGNLESKDQFAVEMPILAFSLVWDNCRIWNQLNEAQKRSVSSWLLKINDVELPENNWQVFRIVVNICLKILDAEYSESRIARSVGLVDSFYQGDGWYSDGVGERFDHYIAMSIHFYLLLTKRIFPEIEERIDVSGRAAKFAVQYALFFSSKGDALPYGRSLSYRFAHASFWGALALSDIEALPWGETKGLYLGNMRYWFGQPITNGDGQLTIGYSYPNALLAEYYIGPGSVYWALSAFVPLLLSENHDFWRSEEKVDARPIAKKLGKPGFLLSRSDDGEAITVLSGKQQSGREFGASGEKYSKFAYSNKFGFSISRGSTSLELGAFDSMLALRTAYSDWLIRRRNVEYAIHDNHLFFSVWKPSKGITVKTRLVDFFPWHLRVHEISSRLKLSSAEGAFAAPIENSSNVRSDKNEFSAYYAGSGITDVSRERKGIIVIAFPNTNILFSRSVIPMLTSEIGVGRTVLGSLVLGDANPNTQASNWENPPKQEDYIDYLDFNFNR